MVPTNHLQLDKTFLIVGGRNNTRVRFALDTLYEFDVEGNKWLEKPQVNTHLWQSIE